MAHPVRRSLILTTLPCETATERSQDVAAYRLQRVGIGAPGAVTQSWFYQASENYFDVLGVQPALGRFFHPSDAHGVNSAPYIVLSYAYWQRYFHADPTVIGRGVDLNQHPYTVLGVAPATFTGTELFLSPNFWTPLVNQPELDGYNALDARNRSNRSTWVLGRLKPGLTTLQAEADINGIATRLASRYKEDDGLAFRLSQPGLLGDTLGQPVRAFLFGVLALAALVLIAACANLGSLFAARAADRARELAVRLALGATRVTLVAQLLTEAVLVSILGGVLGLGLAAAALRGLSLWRPSPELPIAVVVHADLREIGVRMALGASRGHILRGVLRSSALLTILVCAAGLAGALLLGPVLNRWILANILAGAESGSGLLFSSGQALVSAILALSLVTLLAALVPAQKAAGVQPMEALRAE